MARPRLHAIGDLLDVAERLATDADTTGLTLRALAETADVPIGSIYHAFASKDDLLARLWLRAANRLSAIRRQIPTPADGAAGPGTGAIVAAAVAPVELARRHPASARLFFAQRRDQLFSTELSEPVATELIAMQAGFVDLLMSLARTRWGRTDRIAVDAVAACVVDIPTGLLRRPLVDGAPLGAVLDTRIASAVRAVLSLPLEPEDP